MARDNLRFAPTNHSHRLSERATGIAEPVAANQWYAIATLDEVPVGRAAHTELLGVPMSYCRNRNGEPLAWLTQDSPTADTPVDDETPLEDRLPTLEKYGYLWSSVGQPDDGLFDIHEAAEPDRRVFNAVTIGIFTSGPRAVENFLDMGHLPFVHSGSLGQQPFTEIVDYEVERRGSEIVASNCLIFQPKATAASTSGQMVNYTFRVPHPLCALLYKGTPEDDIRLDVIGLFVHPVREDRIRAHLFSCLLDRTNTDKQIRRFHQTVLAQDKPILENQVPKRLPLDPDSEVPTRADKTSNAYRRWLSDLGMTYGVAPPR